MVTPPQGNFKDLGIASMADARRVNSTITFSHGNFNFP